MADPVARSLAAKIAANERWSRVADRSAEAAPLWRSNPTQLSYWERKIDPDGTLSAAERNRRATQARRAYMQKLALKSRNARAVRKRKGTAK